MHETWKLINYIHFPAKYFNVRRKLEQRLVSNQGQDAITTRQLINYVNSQAT